MDQVRLTLNRAAAKGHDIGPDAEAGFVTAGRSERVATGVVDAEPHGLAGEHRVIGFAVGRGGRVPDELLPDAAGHGVEPERGLIPVLFAGLSARQRHQGVVEGHVECSVGVVVAGDPDSQTIRGLVAVGVAVDRDVTRLVPVHNETGYAILVGRGAQETDVGDGRAVRRREVVKPGAVNGNAVETQLVVEAVGDVQVGVGRYRVIDLQNAADHLAGPVHCAARERVVTGTVLDGAEDGDGAGRYAGRDQVRVHVSVPGIGDADRDVHHVFGIAGIDCRGFSDGGGVAARAAGAGHEADDEHQGCQEREYFPFHVPFLLSSFWG